MPKTKKRSEIKVAPIDFYLESDRIIFTIGEKEFFLSKEKAVVLFGRHIEKEFSRMAIDGDFSTIETIRNAATWNWMIKRDFSFVEIALEINVTVDELLRWVNRRGHKINEFLSQRTEKIKEIESALEERHPRFEPAPVKNPGNFDLKRARWLIVNEELDFREAAKEMKMTEQEFKVQWQIHLNAMQRKIGG